MARMHNFHRSRSGKLQEGVGIVKEETKKIIYSDVDDGEEMGGGEEEKHQ